MTDIYADIMTDIYAESESKTEKFRRILKKNILILNINMLINILILSIVTMFLEFSSSIYVFGHNKICHLYIVHL